MRRRWVCNASPLIVLAKTGHVHLLPACCDDLIVPADVAEEIERGAQNDPARIWLHSEGSRFVQPLPAVSQEVAAWDLGHGETAVLSWAYQHQGFEALVDDRAARTCAQALAVPVRGTIGIILLAKRLGEVERVAPLLQQVTAAGLHLSAGLFQAALALAGEA